MEKREIFVATKQCESKILELGQLFWETEQRLSSNSGSKLGKEMIVLKQLIQLAQNAYRLSISNLQTMNKLD